MPPPPVFDVHLYAIVRFQVDGISAASPAAAVESARCHLQTDRWLRRLENASEMGEFAEEFPHYLVDVADDPEFQQSCWFHAEETPLLQILRTLVRWDDQGRPPDGLCDLLAEVRHILFRSL